MKTEHAALPRSHASILIFALIAFGTLVTAILLSTQLAVSRSNEISAMRQTTELQLALSEILDEVAQAQQGIAEWDLLVEELMNAMPDQSWLDTNVGNWLHRLFRHDLVFILGPSDKFIYGNISGQMVTAAAYSSYQSDISRFIGLARGTVTKLNNRHERLPGQSLHEDASVRTTAEALHATDVAVIAQRPAVVSVMRITRQASTTAADSAAQNLLISVRFLDGPFLHSFSRDNLIKDLHYHSVRSHHHDPTERIMALTSSTDATLGYFMWRPDLPGSELWRSILPALASFMAGAAVLVAVYAFRTYQLLRKQDIHMRELQETHLALKASEAHAQHLAFHDVLTGLPNRAFFSACVDQALVRRQPDSQCALLLLDLDKFKQVNDSLGHAAGDALIQEFADRARACLDSGSAIARLGGDEFAVLIENATEESMTATIERLLQAVQTPFDLLSSRVFVGVSIGVSIAPLHGSTRSELLRKADIALYAAKDLGRCQFCFFVEAMDETRKEKAAIEEDLRLALKNSRQLQVFYQPQVDSATQHLVGVEALLRWHHPTRGAIPPQIFVPIAESSGLIVELGHWILSEVCKAALQWPGLSIAVNLSPVQFRSDDFAPQVIELVHTSGVNASQIEFEITEGVLIEDDGKVQRAIAKLRQAGFRIALDDFGTGYSSLSYLQKFEVDKIKIDRSFVANIGQGGDSSAIVKAVVMLGRSMGLTVNAEGVETTVQRDFLRTAGCDELQGFLFSRAVPEAEITSRLQRTPEPLNKSD